MGSAPEENGSSSWRRTLSHVVRSRSAVGNVHPYLYRHSISSRLDYRDTNRRRRLCDHLEHRSRRAVCSIAALIDPYRSNSTKYAKDHCAANGERVFRGRGPSSGPPRSKGRGGANNNKRRGKCWAAAVFVPLNVATKVSVPTPLKCSRPRGSGVERN
jgi:hypothetical protein